MNKLDISKHIKCSACGKIRYGTGPYQCSNGHLICRLCQPGTVICSQCQVSVEVPIKCHAAVDILMDKIPVPCFFKSRGCSLPKMERAEMRNHIAVCPFSDIDYAKAATQTPSVVAGNINTVTTGSGIESGIENQNADGQLVAREDVNSGLAEANPQNANMNSGLAEANPQNANVNSGRAETDHDDHQDENSRPVEATRDLGEGRSAEVPNITPKDDEDNATEETVHQEENANVGVADQDHNGNQNATDAPTEMEAENGPDLAYQAKADQDEGAGNTSDEPGGDNELSSVPIDDNGGNNEGTDEFDSLEKALLGSEPEPRYEVRKRRQTELYTATFASTRRKRVKLVAIASSVAPTPARKPVFVARIGPGRPKKLDKNQKLNGRPAYKCGDCNRIFLSNHGLVNHRRVHRIKTRKRYPCRFCNVKFPQREDLAVHLANFHCNLAASGRNKDGIFVDYYLCKFCAFVYEKDELPEHISGRHNNKF